MITERKCSGGLFEWRGEVLKRVIIIITGKWSEYNGF